MSNPRFLVLLVPVLHVNPWSDTELEVKVTDIKIKKVFLLIGLLDLGSHMELFALNALIGQKKKVNKRSVLLCNSDTLHYRGSLRCNISLFLHLEMKT